MLVTLQVAGVAERWSHYKWREQLAEKVVLCWYHYSATSGGGSSREVAGVAVRWSELTSGGQWGHSTGGVSCTCTCVCLWDRL